MKQLAITIIMTIGTICIAPGGSSAQVIFSVGDGSAVANPDFVATFDSLASNGQDVSNYEEGGLSITSDGTYFGFDAFRDGTTLTQFHYATSTSPYAVVQRVNSEVLFGIELRVGDGITDTSTTTNVLWETWLNGSMTDSGFEESILYGERIGFRDNLIGFDELRIAANSSFTNASQLGDAQAIAIDDVLVSTTAVPEPASGLGVSFVALGLAVVRRRRNS